jgi:hypothetical protein
MKPRDYDEEKIDQWLKAIALKFDLLDLECQCTHSSIYHCLPLPNTHPIGKSGCLKCNCVDFIESLSSCVHEMRLESEDETKTPPV